MAAQLLEFSLPPALLRRGFWLYAWKICGPKDEELCYIGMTGDVNRVAQSPFVRAHQHLGENNKNNALRRCLLTCNIKPEDCKELIFSAYGPIYDYNPADAVNYQGTRRKVGALERALWDALERDGFELVNNRPASRSDYDGDLFEKIRSAFMGRFPSQRLMSNDAYPDAFLRDILLTAKTIAVVGASDRKTRPSHAVFAYLLARGYHVIGVNPCLAGKSVHGTAFFKTLADVPGPIDMVDIFRNPAAAGGVVDEALALHPRPSFIWMQLGVRDDAAAARAQALGVKVIMNRCPKIEYERLAIGQA